MADLTKIAAAAFPRSKGRKRTAATRTAEERDELIAKLMGPLWGTPWYLASPDHDLAEELRAHVLFKCELGRYDPRRGAFAAWVRTVMTRQLITLLQSRGRAAGGEAARPEREDTRRDPDADDARTAPFTEADLDRVRKWTSLKRVLLLTRSLLWGKLPADLWAETLAAVGLPATFPRPEFEDMSVAERNEYLAGTFGVPKNTIHVRMGRWERHLFDLQFVRDLSAGR